MFSLYEKNGLIFWTEKQIKIRKMLETFFVDSLRETLRSENKVFEFIQIEAPLLTPREFINPQYTSEDIYVVEDLALRPETTMGSYRYAQELLRHKARLPLVIWQHGKSFRREQDQVQRNMRLKEFYQLEFQCIYSPNTANDYAVAVVPAVEKMISKMIGICYIEQSDRLPDYSESTTDIVCSRNKMEVCSISKRKDFENAKVLEIAIGTDRCVYNFELNDD
jgi:glycyl-tRNA synthetase